MIDGRALTGLSTLAAALRKSERALSVLNAAGMGLFLLGVLFVTVDVILRYGFNRPILGDVELIEEVMVIAVYFGMAYTQLKKRHVSVSMLADRLSPKGQVFLNSAIYFITLVTVSLLIWRSFLQAQRFDEHGDITFVLHVPLSPFALIICFGYIMLWLMLLTDLVNKLVEGLKLHLGRRLWLSLLGVVVIVLLVMIALMQPLPWRVSPPLVGLLGIVLILLVIYCGIPVAFVLTLIGFLGLSYLRGHNAGLDILGLVPYRAVANYTWAAVGFFIYMGLVCFYMGISTDIYISAYKWVGHQPGGLAIATVLGCTAFGAICGDSLATAVTMGTVSLPEMKKFKYDLSLASGCVAAGGGIGVLIPPSIPFIIYALLTEQSVGTLFIAGIIPGLFLCALFVIYIYVKCRLNPNIGPMGPKTSLRDKVGSLRSIWPVAVLFLLVIGGLYAGLCTPTEGGALGACGALVIALSMRRITWRNFNNSLIESGLDIAMLFVIAVGASIFGYMVTVSKLPIVMANSLITAQLSPLLCIVGILIILLILGCIMPALPMVLLCTPIFYPVILAAGYDPIWFGVIMVIMFQLGGITPPYGFVAFVLAGLRKDISVGTIFRGALPFVYMNLICIAILTAFPQITTWLPNLLRG